MSAGYKVNHYSVCHLQCNCNYNDIKMRLLQKYKKVVMPAFFKRESGFYYRKPYPR